MSWKSRKAYTKWYSKESNKEKVKKRVAGRKKTLAEWLGNYKKTHSCVDCGCADYRVLTFHHTGTKRYDVSNMPNTGCSIETMQNEIENCIVLCANCHTIRHLK